jgi:BA14K-like protein
MFKTINMLREFQQNHAALSVTGRRLGVAVSVCVSLACTTVVCPAFAATRYDGGWSVVISTSNGACEPSVRFGVQINNGRVIAGNGAADVQGRVTRAGAVRVSVQSGNASAQGTGHLGAVSGGGVWQGQGASGTCAGTWVAQRTGYGRSGAPIYNFAPNGFARGREIRPGTADCAARFRSYNPATGTYLGYDGLRHPCS